MVYQSVFVCIGDNSSFKLYIVNCHLLDSVLFRQAVNDSLLNIYEAEAASPFDIPFGAVNVLGIS